jgi:uracil-DNA glycosylase family 4
MTELADLLTQIRACRICAGQLPHEPRPVLRASATAKVLVVGQAPGAKVHQTGIPWNDQSGRKLRQWLGVTEEEFYDESKVAIVPVGFCYPGKGKSGDLPPRKECAQHWHPTLQQLLPEMQLTLLVGQYAQAHFLKDKRKANLTETVKAWPEYLPGFFPLPHPSPLNIGWFRKNNWFEQETVPALQQLIKSILS